MSEAKIYVRTRILDLIFIMLALVVSKLEDDPMFSMFWYFVAGLGFIFVIIDAAYEAYKDAQKRRGKS